MSSSTQLNRPITGVTDAMLAQAAAFLEARRAKHGDLRMEATGGDTGGGQTDGQADGGQSGQQGADQGGQSTSGGQTGGQQPAAPEWDGKVESLHPDVQRVIRDLRTENAQRRTGLTAAEQKQQEMVRAFAKAAGIQLPDDQQAPDPAQLTEQLTAAQQAQRQTAVELAVYRTAAKHQGDPDALLDSRAFLAKVADLDPAADDFAANVDTAIKQAVDANPKLKAGRAPGASGTDHPGGPGEGPRKPHTLEEAVALKLGA